MTRSFHIAPFLLVLCLFSTPPTLQAALSDIKLITRGVNDTQLPIFTEGYTEPEWDTMRLPCNACNPPNIIGEKIYNDSRIFEINNTGTTQITLDNMVAFANNSAIFNPSMNLSSKTTLNPGETIFFNVTYNCNNNTILEQDLDGWSYIEITLHADGEPIRFNYLRVCTLVNRDSPDYSIYVVLTIAVIVVTFATRQKKTLLGDQADHMDEIKPAHAFFFIVFASISLLTLYFFSQYIKGILSVIFIAYALTGCTIVFTQWTEKFVSRSATWKKHYNLYLIGPVNLHGLACFMVALAIVISWFITRAWYLNNIIGLSIVCLIFKIVKLPSLKVAYLLLGLAFFYDIFWVFISKPIFGESVMVVAATALDLPIKIEWPYLGASPIPRCSILGLGDMVLPGFFVTFNYRFGLYKRSGAYYLSSVIAYAFGLALCGGFLIIMRMGQPALLYLVPSLLGAATVLSLKRGEFKEMWEGIPEQEEYKNFDPDRVQLSEIHMS